MAPPWHTNQHRSRIILYRAQRFCHNECRCNAAVPSSNCTHSSPSLTQHWLPPVSRVQLPYAAPVQRPRLQQLYPLHPHAARQYGATCGACTSQRRTVRASPQSQQPLPVTSCLPPFHLTVPLTAAPHHPHPIQPIHCANVQFHLATLL